MPSITFQNFPLPSGGNVGVIQKFFETANDLLFSHSSSHPGRNTQIRVYYGTNGPVTAFGGNNITGWDVYLTAEDDDWCKHVYQFAHEACHVFAQMQQAKHANQWFEESVCEAASLYVLQTISEMGANGRGPCVGFCGGGMPFHEAMKRYVDDLLQAPIRQASDAELKKSFKQNETQLRNDPYWKDREFNNVVANRLFPLFTSTPANWAAIEFLNATPCSATGDSLSDYLANWEKAAGGGHSPFIEIVGRMLL
jgi:hypothetical protein